jgi:hypothetical protein
MYNLSKSFWVLSMKIMIGGAEPLNPNNWNHAQRLLNSMPLRFSKHAAGPFCWNKQHRHLDVAV